MRHFFTAAFITVVGMCSNAHAQSWTGNVDTHWNLPGNWDPAVVPGWGSTVSIPNTGRKPQLDSNVRVRILNMSSGSAIDTKGYSITISTDHDLENVTFNNTAPSSDIVIIANGGSYNWIRGCTFNDDLVFTYNGSGQLLEGYYSPCTYNGNATFNIGGTGTVSICYGQRSAFNGKLTIVRTVAGTTEIFKSGTAGVSGDLRYTNTVGGLTSFNEENMAKATIGGKIDLQVTGAGFPDLYMYKLTNLTTGGVIDIQNCGVFRMLDDTLVVSSFTVNGFASSSFHDLNQCKITGPVVLSDHSTNTGLFYLRGSTFMNSFTYNINSLYGNMYEGYTAPNVFNGQATFNAAGGASLNICYDQKSTYNGNLTVSRTVAGETNLLMVGAASIAGDLRYTNHAGGQTRIGEGSVYNTTVNGKVFINANAPGSPDIMFKKVSNLTPGGLVDIRNCGRFICVQDTLTVDSFMVRGFSYSIFTDLDQNKITGTVKLSDAPGNIGGTYIRGNRFTGTFTFTHNAVNGGLYEGYSGANVYNGNATFNAAGSASMYLSYDQPSTFNGHLNIVRTVAGETHILQTGTSLVTGDLNYTNHAGGASFINEGNTLPILIQGKVNIASNPPGDPNFVVYKMKNQTGGGTIDIRNSGMINFTDDTLVFASMNIIGLASNFTSDLLKDQFTGQVTIADRSTNGTAFYIRGCTMNGNFSYTINSTYGNLYESYVLPNTFNGNAVFNAAGTAALEVCYDQRSSYNGDLTVNRTVIGDTRIFNAAPMAMTGNLSYTNLVGGNTVIGSVSGFQTVIGGKIDIRSELAPGGYPNYTITNIRNNTTGGKVRIANCGWINMSNDTLQLDSLTVQGFGAVSFVSDFYRNDIAGTVILSELPITNAPTYMRGNVFRGPMMYTQNSTQQLYESFSYPDVFMDDVAFIRNAGAINISYDQMATFHKKLSLVSATGINFGLGMRAAGNADGLLEQVGTQPISMPTLIMDKTGTAALSLSDSVTITNTLTFINGNIINADTAAIIFPDNVSYTGASATSHVTGPVIKLGDDAFIFPVGRTNTINTVAMSAPETYDSRFRAAYVARDPNADGFNTSIKAGSFGSALICRTGYWNVQRLAGTTNVTLTFGFGNNDQESYPVLSSLKVAHWSGSQWDDHGNGGTTGSPASGTIVNAIPITSFSPFAIAGVDPVIYFTYANVGAGPDGTPIKLGGTNATPPYLSKQLPSGTYTADSIYLITNGAAASFRIKDGYNIEKDTTVIAPTAPTTYATVSGSGMVNFSGWRHFVYMKDAGGNMMGAIKDNGLTLGNTTMNTYLSTGATVTAPNGNRFLKRSFKVGEQFTPPGNAKLRLYISKTEFNDLQNADLTSFPSGINSLTVERFSGAASDSVLNPTPAGTVTIIPNTDISITDLGTMYALDVDLIGSAGYFIGGNMSTVGLCPGSNIALPAGISGSTYKWQVDDGSGFADLSNNATYSGVTTNMLSISGATTGMYGNRYRCMVNGSIPGQVYQLKFVMTWYGTNNTAWEQAGNWSCGVLPDLKTDVIVNAGRPNNLQVNSNASVRSLRLNPGAVVTVKAGFNLTIRK